MARTRVRSRKGFNRIVGRKGALHRQLGVPEGEPIPEGKKAAALAGRFGPLAKRRAVTAFRGALAAGRKTVASRAALTPEQKIAQGLHPARKSRKKR